MSDPKEEGKQQENPQEQGKKVQQQFERTIKKLVAIVDGNKNLKPKKVKADEIGEIVTGLFKEEREAAATQVKEDLKTLLKGYVQLNKEIEEEKNKLTKLEQQKKKEFNEVAGKLFNKIDGLDNMEKSYYSAFNAASEAAINPLNSEDIEIKA